MDETKRSWIERTLAMLERTRDEIRCAYVGIAQECGKETANAILENAGKAVVAAREIALKYQRGETPRTKPAAPPPAESDEFG